jgi:hypothetical protein
LDQGLHIIANTAAGDSSISRGVMFRVRDLTVDQAKTYLTIVRKLSDAEAAKILEFCGCRILQLAIACDYLENHEREIDGLPPPPPFLLNDVHL